MTRRAPPTVDELAMRAVLGDLYAELGHTLPRHLRLRLHDLVFALGIEPPADDADSTVPSAPEIVCALRVLVADEPDIEALDAAGPVLLWPDDLGVRFSCAGGRWRGDVLDVLFTGVWPASAPRSFEGPDLHTVVRTIRDLRAFIDRARRAPVPRLAAEGARRGLRLVVEDLPADGGAHAGVYAARAG